MENGLALFADKRTDFLGFLRTRYSLFHQSNLFFRDLHYGVMAFLEMNGLRHAYAPSEELTRKVIGSYEKDGLLLPIDERTWMLNYQPFRKAPAKPAPAAKPAPTAQAPKPAAGPIPTSPKSSAVTSASAPSAPPSKSTATQEIAGAPAATGIGPS